MGSWVPEKKRMGLVGFSELKYVCFGLWRHGGFVDAQADVLIANASVLPRCWAEISALPLAERLTSKPEQSAWSPAPALCERDRWS